MPSPRPKRIEAPAAAAVALADLKRQCRVTHNEDDAALQSFLDSAIGYVDGLGGILGRCLISQAWRFSLRDWPCGGARIAMADVTAVAVQYQDSNDATQTLSPGAYRQIETARGTVLEWTDAFDTPSVFDRADAIRIDVTAGFGAASGDVPAQIRHAILMLAAAWYENREAAVAQPFEELPFSVQCLLGPHRRNTIA